jgi:hypothetical protein
MLQCKEDDDDDHDENDDEYDEGWDRLSAQASHLCCPWAV